VYKRQGGGDAGGGSTGSKTLAALTLTSFEAAGSNCASGGSRIDAGLDANTNDFLDGAEISSSQYVCNGSLDVVGSADVTHLVALTPEAVGANCSAGGSTITVGQDVNRNGILDSGEVASSRYACLSTADTSGTTPLSFLMAVSVEPVGAHCTYGGNKVSSGRDTDADHVLDIAEITSTQYNCNSSATDGANWVKVTSASVAAQSNQGYLLDSASPVTLTLPASPQVGDIVQVSGVGTGAWTIAQNAGQSIVTKEIVPGLNPAGVNWVAQTTPPLYWRSIASSSDGSKLAAVASNSTIYTSNDYGITWTSQSSGIKDWTGIASSADGSKLAAVASSSAIYTSNDYGVTWAPQASGAHSWTSITSSSDGSKLAAAAYDFGGGRIFTSSDYGVTWDAHESNRG